MNSLSSLICTAIKEQKLIEFYYDGGSRVVEPHFFGTTTAGNQGLHGYQISGYSFSGEMGWKMFDMSKAGSLQILKETFNGPRPGYKTGDRGMRSIECEI